MPRYAAPVDEVLFVLVDLLGIHRHGNLPGFADATPDLLAAVLGEAGRLAEEVLQPLNASGDREGCRRAADGAVATPAGFRAAFATYAAGGWLSLSGDPAFGGQGLPEAITVVVNEFCTAANMAFTMYPGLTKSAYSALSAHGSEAQKALYLPRLLSGEWLGTMNLTEPQCGTDLGLVRTKAAPQADGSYRLMGQKIYISAGEHDLTPNIVHLVLARIEGAPAGTKGLSLFIVPKVLVEPDGTLGARNAVSCGALERKMGIHANSTCVMDYEGATGWLVGEAGRGLAAMFVMMNEARLGVANQGLALSEVAYQNAAAYAKERLQGRALTGTAAPDRPADPLIVHPDIRRMLLTVRAFNEAARALLLSTAIAVDLSRSGSDAEKRTAEDRLGLMTPVLKGVLTDRGFDNCVLAQQVLGGYGYVADAGLEQFVRDARIAMIYEGTNGIQALDLVGRKLPRDGGRAYTAFVREVSADLEAARDDADLRSFVGPLKDALAALQTATTWLVGNALAKPDHAGAGATDYMHLLGLVALGHMWLRMAGVAAGALRQGPSPAMSTKLMVGRVFMERTLPEAATRLARITAGADALMALPAEAF